MNDVINSFLYSIPKKLGSCVLKASVDRVSVDTLGRYVDRQSADMSTEYRPIYRPTCRPSIGRHVVRVNRPSVDTIGRYVGRHSADISADMSLVHRSTVGGVSVDCRWYRSIVNRCFVEIEAVSLPTGDAKEGSIPYVRVLIERRCSSNCRHFEYISNAT